MQNKIKNYPHTESPIYYLRTKKRLSKILGISIKDIQKLAGACDSYKEWDEINEKGKSRHIENPCYNLKVIQKRIADLLSRISPPDFLFCPVKRRSYITNAKQHVGQKHVVCLDIKEYFVSTSSKRVYWFFHSYMKCSEDVAGILTAISTIKGRLPTGSPLSPILSYFAHVDMWDEISRIAKDAQCIITVYMDDLTISGKEVPQWVMWEIRQQISRCGLKYHKEKNYRNGFSEITGIIVKDKLALPNRQHLKTHKLRKELTLAATQEQKSTILRKISGCKSQNNQVLASNDFI
ncbi:Retron-type reverse transcriptase [Methylomagnum ishizawai]|uniref:Retron-type reverse transcriptase n=1 Tax=Methylomagnum ishizawai TaxID=1760988 RepID=A0A1Y6D4Q3_9GAMM|nr:reverse transcriptase family protein [Methylomagnum ishizawai]SMF97926.1 Retron-type reverse transcriptase [Methylomagnum ishizawai]SMF97938.1 Retron-type reverse transcriptase [Methylomagnum ishizawai]